MGRTIRGHRKSGPSPSTGWTNICVHSVPPGHHHAHFHASKQLRYECPMADESESLPFRSNGIVRGKALSMIP
jgi:hypothetical protein